MATRVKHGPNPKWRLKTYGRFNVLVQGHYTNHPTTGCAGVTAYTYNSERKVKRQSELLVLRTAFIDWFVRQWVKNGGTEAQAKRHIKSLLRSC